MSSAPGGRVPSPSQAGRAHTIGSTVRSSPPPPRTTNGPERLPSDPEERRLRAPVHFLDAIETPTVVIEGDLGGNAAAVRELAAATANPRVDFHLVEGADHFDVLAPANMLLAQRVARLTALVPLRVDGAELQRRFDVALEPRLAAALERDPDDVDARFERARLAYRQERYADAVADYDRVLAAAPDDGPALNNRGWSRYHAGDAAGAVDDFSRYVALFPDDLDGYYGRGIALQELGRRARLLRRRTPRPGTPRPRPAAPAPPAQARERTAAVVIGIVGLVACVGVPLTVLAVVLWLDRSRPAAPDDVVDDDPEPVEDEDGFVDLSDDGVG